MLLAEKISLISMNRIPLGSAEALSYEAAFLCGGRSPKRDLYPACTDAFEFSCQPLGWVEKPSV